MKILSWNINGLKSIINKNFVQIIKELNEDIICLQEIKITKPIKNFKLEGYYSYYNFSKKPGYSGVATFTKKKPNKVQWGIKLKQDEEEIINDEARVLTLEYNDFYVVNIYIPHCANKVERINYREKFEQQFLNYIKSLEKNVIICGDFNICHKNIDTYNLKINQKEYLKEQRYNFDELINIGLIDTFRYMHPQMRKYTLKLNKPKEENVKYGWRLDYILLSKDIKKEIREANILNNIQGSDHCPVELVLKLSNTSNVIPEKDKVMYISKEYIKGESLRDNFFIKDTLDESTLSSLWQNFDFEKAEKELFRLQCELTKATFSKNIKKRIKIQNEIVHSSIAKMLAVRYVSEKYKKPSGIDDILWETSSEKMKAAISLNNGEYRAKPLKQYVFYESKKNKERRIGVPTIYDRAMQVLYFYSLEPVAEAMADRRSFAYRKGKSPQLIHSYIIKTLTEEQAPEWILVTDVKSYYDTISHEWLMKNLPMDKKILKQFLNSKYIFNGEMFDTKCGISLGCNISVLIGNLTLDGLQKELFSIQKTKEKYYLNGQLFRFADDILVTARTKEDAIIFKNKIEEFVAKRGLKLSQEKTKIVNIKDGFDFLSRFYFKSNGIVKCIPSETAVAKFEEEVKMLIYANKDKLPLRKLIEKINNKIMGFSTYHKVEESSETFIHLDVVINTLMLKIMKEKHPTYTIKKLESKYWEKDSIGRMIFHTPGKRKKYLKNMADTILVKEKSINLKKNIFLDKKYFDELTNDKKIQNVVGRYRRIYEKQNGKCYLCSKELKLTDVKKIIYKKNIKDRTIKNMAYIHANCEGQIIEYTNVRNKPPSPVIVKELLNEVVTKNSNSRRTSKFYNLTIYFHNLKKNKVKLTFKALEKILKFKLCDSAYKHKAYFYNNNVRSNQ